MNFGGKVKTLQKLKFHKNWFEMFCIRVTLIRFETKNINMSCIQTSIQYPFETKYATVHVLCNFFLYLRYGENNKLRLARNWKACFDAVNIIPYNKQQHSDLRKENSFLRQETY